VSVDDVAVAREFLEVLAAGAQTGDLEGVFPFLSVDVEWLTPQRDMRSLGEVREGLARYSPRESLDIDFERQELVDLGDGVVVLDFRELYLTRSTGELAYARERRIQLTVREGKIARYEMRFAG
jgi:ketosteroid isomerase-like protein